MVNISDSNMKLIKKYSEYIMYFSFIILWIFLSYMSYMDLIVYYDESFKTFLISLLLPISIPVILIFCLCILYHYVSIGFSCFEKIFTGESWDFFETLWFISLFFDDN